MSGFDDENPDDSSGGVPERLKRWWAGAKDRLNLGGLTNRVKDGLKKGGGGVRRFEFKKIELEKVAENSHRIRWALIVLGVFLAADIAARILGMFFSPTYTSLQKKQTSAPSQKTTSAADYDAILRRNMFNVEQKIPAPFDQGQLDCLSQAKPSTQRIRLLGTIVMNDEIHSVALIQEEGSPTNIAVKKDENFMDGRYQAKKVERKKLCFQVKASGDFEFVEIPDDSLGMSGPALSGDVRGISPIGEGKYAVEKGYLDSSLKNLPDIVNTARAVPYNDPNTGKFAGFLIQSIDPTSPFAALGVQRGDILTNVNDIIFDNPGRGIEAFNRLKTAPKISMGVIRNGSKQTLEYEVK